MGTLPLSTVMGWKFAGIWFAVPVYSSLSTVSCTKFKKKKKAKVWQLFSEFSLEISHSRPPRNGTSHLEIVFGFKAPKSPTHPQFGIPHGEDSVEVWSTH